ncbi:MAG: MaoC family dehydratase N-terminal domain-containing protein [Desulfuromonadaceae bacterium]|nr:MaoC family dehydratase N-terminal domain-containing protein [Desulfuromonadaceae bacterium]
MSVIDLDYLRTWIGTSRIDEDLIAARHARLMAATVDCLAMEKICDGELLPPLWHWIYFLEGMPSRELGLDGHPVRGGFMPPVSLSNRMWAGGRVSFLAPVQIGSSVRKKSTILKVDHKRGTSGDLVFVTVLHELTSLQGELLIREEQDIVYKNSTPPKKTSSGVSPIPSAQFMKAFTPDSTTLFRYSALTFNGHRIHYDVDYCRKTEGYRNLVIHGPLNATMLAAYAEEISGRRVHNFSYRGLSPAFVGDSIMLQANVLGDKVTLNSVLGTGAVCMQAEALIA